MKKFFLKEGEEKAGPFDIDELKAKGVTAETAVWVEGQPDWTTAGNLDELKDMFTPIPPAVPTEEPLPTVKPVEVEEPIATTAAATTATTVPVTPAAPAPKPAAKSITTGKKSTAWVSWLLTLVVLGGAGYFVYQDMEKNKTPSADERTLSISDTATTTEPVKEPVTNDPAVDSIPVSTVTTEPTTTTTTTEPVTTTTTTTTNADRQTAAQKNAAKKAEEDKRKKLALESDKKAAAEKKKLADAQAAQEAKEKNFRNRWPNYISFGSLNYTTKGDGIQAFDVPLYNGTDAMLDKVTVRIEYLKKKETKIYKTETITITNIPPRTTVNGRAPESKKGEKVNVFITGITSKKLHFCYPVNNGNADDPYFCN
jgi:hypothetical protein